jgi:hypothetical protein
VNLDAQTLFGWPLRRARNGNRREKTSFKRASIRAFFQTEREKTFSTAALVIVTSNFSGSPGQRREKIELFDFRREDRSPGF